ncbi:MAG TPA: hypothetical protein VLA16_24720 [Ideonella sp.]|nr:hypothetical protein [Ideonella sp.]
MNETPESERGTDPGPPLPHHQQTEKYGGGHIEARHGRINRWLLVVYLILFVWALYYGYVYWGGLGPGLDLSK